MIEPDADRIRDMVIEHFQRCAEHGSSDEELYARYPQIKESSLRARRIEISHYDDKPETFGRALVKAGFKRTAKSGVDVTVWILRDFR